MDISEKRIKVVVFNLALVDSSTNYVGGLFSPIHTGAKQSRTGSAIFVVNYTNLYINIDPSQQHEGLRHTVMTQK